jgi:histidinol phosphatase-like PHP family hydrolase
MYDLHTHTIFSDGELIPSELLRRAEVIGLKAIAFTDHADASNIDFIISKIIKVCNELNKLKKIKCLPGVEITHCPPPSIQSLVKKARNLGAKVVVVHGETIVEPVEKGTNIAAIRSRVDILAHPGLITDDEVKEAVKNGVFLEISGRKGHSLGNGHVVNMAKKYGAKLIVNSDAHSPDDLASPQILKKIALGAGVTEKEYRILLSDVEKFIRD